MKTKLEKFKQIGLLGALNNSGITSQNYKKLLQPKQEEMVRKLEVKSNLEKVIEKGGHVSADKAEKKEWKLFQLRLRNDIEESIDKMLQHRVGMSKTAWILEAIQEKIKRTENENE